jgi:DNA-binding response OmpR family regulator
MMMTESRKKLLLVEDDPVLGRGLNINLEAEGFEVSWSRDLKSAAEAYQLHAPKIIILDLNLPDGNGMSFLKQIRDGGSKTPVIILTAKTHEDSVVDGLHAGANDYVRKPFGNKELLARIQGALRDPATPQQLKYDDLVISLEKRKVMFRDKEVELNRREFEVLCYFIENAESVVTRDKLLSALNKDGEIFDRTIDSHVSHVRARLRQAEVTTIQISSVYGVGYRLEKTPEKK